MEEPKTEKLECLGCKSRDRIIKQLAEHIDKQSREIKELQEKRQDLSLAA